LLVLVTDPLAEIKLLIESRPDADQRELLSWLRTKHPIHKLETEFGAPAEVILEAIARASDLSRRGVLGLIAEASFKVNIVDELEGWADLPFSGDAAYDFLLKDDAREARVQVKRQRLSRSQPMRYAGGSQKFVAETQRSRRGIDPRTGEDTRPYRFGEFDILAVCTQPVTGDWATFRFTLARWLIPREDRPEWIKVLQPVSIDSDDEWCGSFSTAIRWLDSSIQKTITP